MPLWHRVMTLWRNLAQKRIVENDLDDEIRSYRQLLEDEKSRSGIDANVAKREASLELGGVDQIKEGVRDIRLGVTVETLVRELRQSLRGLHRNPSLTVLGAMMLAVAIGASTVVFSIFHAALIKPLPFRDSERVVQLWETRKARGFNRASFSEANFWDVRAQNRAFEEMGAYRYDEGNLTGMGPAERVTLASINPGFFRTLGVSPVLGRDFSYDEGAASGNRVAIVGNNFWKKRFSADPGILGKVLRFDNRLYTVIGVMPPGQPWIDAQVFLPFAFRANANRSSWEFEVIGRLRPKVTIESAGADLERIGQALAEAYPKEDKGIGFRLSPSSDWVANDATRRALWVLLAAVTSLSFIACLNVTNLLLARGTARQREIAVRTALGASRTRLVRFVMLESVLLSGFGTALGLMFAYGGLRVVQSMEIRGIPRLIDATLNPWVLGFAIGLALLTGVVSGIAPALQVPADRIGATLVEGGRQTGSRRQERVRAFLVAGEVALSFLLLVGAGLLIRSFTQLMNVDRGFETENRLLFTVSMPGSYWEKGVGKQFLDRFLERLTAIPEVIAAGAVSHRAVEGGNPGMNMDSNFRKNGSSDQGTPWVGWRVVSPGYFRAAGVTLRHGRVFNAGDKSVFTERDDPLPARRIVIGERVAKLLFGDQDPVGKHAILWKGQANLDAEVVGVVADTRERGLASNPALIVYLPYGGNALTTEFVLHTRGNPLALTPTVRSIVAELDPDLPVAEVRTFDTVVNRSVAPQRMNAIFLGVFSGLALLLATLGVYGVLSYSLSRRTSEIGLRVALGATGANILGMTIWQGLRPALLGIVVGAFGAAWMSRYFASLLFGVRAFDPLTYAAVAALLLLTAVAASFLPARRAMRTDPAIALRVE